MHKLFKWIQERVRRNAIVVMKDHFQISLQIPNGNKSTQLCTAKFQRILQWKIFLR